MNYRKNIFALLVAGTLIAGCGGGGTDISGGSSGGSTGTGSGSGSSGSGTTTTAYTLSVETCSNSTATACDTITELSLQNTNYVATRLVDASGQPVSGKVITLSTDRGTVKPSSGKLTDSNGYAVFSLTSASLSDAGELSNITASNTNATSITDSISYGSNANLAFTFTSDVSTLAQGATAALSVAVTLNGQPYKTPVGVGFSSTCLTASKAVLTDKITTDINGLASVTYKGVSADGTQACVGADTIVATLDNNDQHQLTITNQLAPSSTIIAGTPSPEFITLHGYNGASSRITFTVKNSEGTAVPAQTVNLAFALPSIAANGYSLSPTTAQTDSNGQVTVTVNAGSIPVPVAVKASLPNTNIQTVSLPIAVGTGYPDSNSFSFSADVYSIEGQTRDGSTATITMRLADRFNNPIPDGTKIYFTTEGGSIEGNLSDGTVGSTPDCTTKSSSCSAILKSMNPRPADGRVTVLAYTEGEESFEDQNGNGILDVGDYVSSALLFDDVNSEPYLDANNSGNYESGEQFVNLNPTINQTWDAANGVYHGLACDDGVVANGACLRNTIELYHNAEFIFSSIANNSDIIVEHWNGSKWVAATSPLDVSVTGYYRFLPLNVATDGKTYNPLPGGAKISVATTNGGDISNGMPVGFIPGTPTQESDTYNAYVNNYPSIHPGDKTGPIDLSISTDITGSTDVGATRPYFFYFIVKPEEKPNSKTTGTLTISATTGSGASTGAGGAIKASFDANDNG
jgi:hypothetical protein